MELFTTLPHFLPLYAQQLQRVNDLKRKNVRFQCLTRPAKMINITIQPSGNLHQNSFLIGIARFSLKYYSKKRLVGVFLELKDL